MLLRLTSSSSVLVTIVVQVVNLDTSSFREASLFAKLEASEARDMTTQRGRRFIRSQAKETAPKQMSVEL